MASCSPTANPLDAWRDFITGLYPEALTRTYCVPPLHLNRVPHDKKTVPHTREPVLVLPDPHGKQKVHVQAGAQAPIVYSPGRGVNQEMINHTPAKGANVPMDKLKPNKGSSVPMAKLKPNKGAKVPMVKLKPNTGANIPMVKGANASHSGRHSPVRPPANGAAGEGSMPPRALWTPVPPGAVLPVQESDVHDDFGQNHVVTNLQALGEKLKEPMFILSQLNFGHYLNKPAYAAVVSQLPRPADLNREGETYSDGESDVIVFHRRHGVMIGELKSVGRWHSCHGTSAEDTSVAGKVEKAAKQLSKSLTIVSHLLSDIAPALTLKATLFLPFLGSEQLHRVLTSYPQLLGAVCQCLGTSNISQAVQMCVCAGQLSDPDTYWDVTSAVLDKLSTWWRFRMATTEDSLLCGPGGDDLYLDIVARFVGPASTVSVHCPVPPRVEVRTAGQAVAELGQRLSRLVLTPQQLDLLTRDPPLVYLTGPPGTGKTVLLVLQGLRWLRQGHDLHVVSTHVDTRAVSLMMVRQLRVTLAADAAQVVPRPGVVHFHQYDFMYSSEQVEKALVELTVAARRGALCVIMDEVFFGQASVSANSLVGTLTCQLTCRLNVAVEHLHLWCAGLFYAASPPCLAQEVLSEPLRSAPSVLREVRSLVADLGEVMATYSDCSLPAPGDGPAAIRLRHSGIQHTGQWPLDCEVCGQDVATTLTQLGVGSADQCSLSWRDVFILSSRVPQEDLHDAHGAVTSPASGLVRGLRGAGVPVVVLGLYSERQQWETRVTEVATAESDTVTVADYGFLHGLERRLVVWIEDKLAVHPWDRLFSLSRCTTQLVIVDLP